MKKKSSNVLNFLGCLLLLCMGVLIGFSLYNHKGNIVPSSCLKYVSEDRFEHIPYLTQVNTSMMESYAVSIYELNTRVFCNPEGEIACDAFIQDTTYGRVKCFKQNTQCFMKVIS